jgi:His/Glu/Gln/Arg/opine family amino acid ABC transporter permease subunit
MSPLMQRLGSDFLPTFLAGMAVNFEIAAAAVAIGLLVGLPLAYARASESRAAVGLSLTVVGLMRAAPTFVVMFFLLNVIPRNAELFGVPIALSGVMTVALSLVPYSAAYAADAGVEALQQWRRGSHLGALLFLPNMTRAFFVVVMSSGAAAAIGVSEGISVILRQAELLPSLADRLVLFAVGILMFGVPLQLSFALIRWLQRALGSHMTRRQAST